MEGWSMPGYRRVRSGRLLFAEEGSPAQARMEASPIWERSDEVPSVPEKFSSPEPEVAPESEPEPEPKPEPGPEPDPAVETEQVERPPEAGPGSSRKAWAEYAEQQGVTVADDDTRDDIIAKIDG